jgi:prepilin signal peptidase PulO-like enzyme (type II secretory pathway)
MVLGRPARCAALGVFAAALIALSFIDWDTTVLPTR